MALACVEVDNEYVTLQTCQHFTSAVTNGFKIKIYISLIWQLPWLITKTSGTELLLFYQIDWFAADEVVGIN